MSIKTTLVVGVLAFFAATSSQATTVLAMGLDELTQRSDTIVVGTVKSITYGTNDKSGYPETRTELVVGETIYGEEGLAEVTVCTIGGPAGNGKVTVVPGMPRFAVDEKVILFLVRDSAKGVAVPTGLEQGVFRIKVDPDTKTEYIVNQSIDLGVTTLEVIDEKAVPYKKKAENLTYGQFRNVVKDKVKVLKTEKKE
jgi:hypothetical protein